MVYVLIILFSLFVGYILKRNRTISLFVIGALVYIFTNISPDIPDYGNYLQYYYGGEYYRNLLQKGYENVSIFFLNHGYSFEAFRLFLALLTFLIIWFAIQMWTKNVAWVLAVYLVAYFPMDVIQIRNFVMLGFATLGITILSKNGYLKYVLSAILIYIGAQFHTTGLIYLPIAAVTLLPDNIENRIRKYTVPGAVIGTVLFLLGSRTKLLGSLAGLIGRLAGNETEMTNKITSRYATGTSMSMIVVVVAVNLIVWLAVNKIVQYEAENESESMRAIEKVVKNITSYELLLSPLMVIAPDYSRVFRNFDLIIITFFIMILSHNDTMHGSKKVAVLSLMIMSLAGLAVWVRNFGVLF